MLAEHERREPYTELPENISMQLRRIDQELKDKPEHIHQLATSLNALYQKNQRDLSVQKLLSALGFLIGVAGLFVPVFFGS
jgi:VIT1/CCC1 family predicted Fe2+/Mn2+ transporter